MPLKGLILADNFINPCRKLPLRVTQCNFIHKFNSKFSFPHPLYALCKSAQLSRSDPFPTTVCTSILHNVDLETQASVGTFDDV